MPTFFLGQPLGDVSTFSFLKQLCENAVDEKDRK